MARHYCDTTSPTRPCCWAARNQELDDLRASDDLRQAKYDALSCPECGKIYRVSDGVVEDHAAVCEPIPDDRWI